MATKKTVLEYVKNCLSVMDSDEVDSITDTVESQQVANLLQECFFEFINREEWTWLQQPVTLDGTITGPTRPTQVGIDDNIKKIMYVAYDVSSTGLFEYRELHYLSPVDFVKKFSRGGDDKVAVTVGSFKFYIDTSRQPEYWTSFDDENIVVDAYKASVETYVDSDKFSVYGVVIPSFTVDDDHVPDVPVAVVPMLQHTLNAAAMLYFKQTSSPVDEQRIVRQLAQLRREESKTRNRDYAPKKYGRK